MTLSSLLAVTGLEYTYPDATRALKGVNLEVFQGEKLAVLGPNGAGKSTLFLHLNGILRPKSGKVYFKGKEVGYRRQELIQLRQQVGLVFQDPDIQLFAASVVQELAFGPLNLGLPEREVRQRVEAAMGAVGIESLKDNPTHLLSYGQKKSVCIAAVLAMAPEVLILDEPTAWLDPRQSQALVALMDKLNRQGYTFILSTHDVNLAYSWADRIAVLGDGVALTTGTPEEVFNDAALLERASLTQPWLLEVGRELAARGLLPSGQPLPRSKDCLLNYLRPIPS